MLDKLCVYVLIFSITGLSLALMISYVEWRDGIAAKRKQRHAKRASYYNVH